MQTIPRIDLYRELEVDPAATTATIHAAWKSLLKRHHPDVAADPAGAVDRVKRLNLAHEWLADPRRRALYDVSRRRPTVIAAPRARQPFDQPRAAGSMRTGMPAWDQPVHADPLHVGRPASDMEPTAHNPYREYGPAPRRPLLALSEPTRTARTTRDRLSPFLAPLALAAVLVFVAMSLFLGSSRSQNVAAESTIDPGAGASGAVSAASGVPGSTTTAHPTPSSQLGVLAPGVANSRGLPPPDLARDIRAVCPQPDPRSTVTFETAIDAAPAEVFFVGCGPGHALGPVVYLAGTTKWILRATGRNISGTPQQAFSGRVTDRPDDQFGVVWARDAGVRSTVSLYRVTSTVDAFWDSANDYLSWGLATFQYQAAADPALPGRLIVVEADMNSGTRNCSTCRDHQLYRETYEWQIRLGRGRLVETQREAVGIGP